MARVRVFGITFNADPVEELPNGDWVMRSRAHTGRTVPGTLFTAKPEEILEMAAAEKPMPVNAEFDKNSANSAAANESLAALEAGMAKERETLPTPKELIAKARADGTVPDPRPTERP